MGNQLLGVPERDYSNLSKERLAEVRLEGKREAAIAYLRTRKKWVLEFPFIPSRGADVASTWRIYKEEQSVQTLNKNTGAVDGA